MLQRSINIFYTDDDVEDQLTFIDAVHEVAANVRVTTQTNGDDLLKTLDNPPPVPTVIFLDLNMPVKNGIEVLKEIKEKRRDKNVPIVIFTTSDNASAIEATRELGANLFITKPLTFTLLKGVIKHVLSIDWATFDSSVTNYVYRGN